MGIQERKERERSEMREIITRAALDVYLAEGFDALSIRKIAERIEYSPATIYLYFADKDAIFCALQELAFAEFYKTLSSIDAADPLEALRAGCRRYVEFAIDNPLYYELMFIKEAPMRAMENPDEWRNGFDSYEIPRNILRACSEAGLINVPDLEVATFSLWAHLHGMASLYIRNRLIVIPEHFRQHMIDEAIDFYITMLTK
jgi:AcrR family transcriptional regulator